MHDPDGRDGLNEWHLIPTCPDAQEFM